jgi:hypothetical protein
MKTTFLFFLVLLLISCVEDPESTVDAELVHACPPPGKCNFSIHPDSMLSYTAGETIYSVTIKTGNWLVFDYQFIRDPDSSHADDEYLQTLMFQVQNSSSEFSYSEKQFTDNKAIVGTIYYGIGAGYFPVRSGSIQGKKITQKNWFVNADVTFFNPELNRNYRLVLSDTFQIHY